MQEQKPIRKSSEDGYMLLAVMFLLFLFALSLTIAAPEIAKSIQHDREVETMQRGKQYRRAIQLYYRKFTAYPPSIDALVKTNNIRFLRKRYTDPMTGKDDWKPILLGQNKQPLALGFFGQPLGGLSGATPIAGTGPTGGNGTAGAGLTGTGFMGGNSGTQSGLGGSLTGASSLLGSSGSGATQNPGTGANSTSGTGGTDANGNPNSGTGQTGTGTGQAGNGTSTGSGTGTGFMSGQTGQAFGGGGIVGVEPASPKQSVLLVKKKNHFSEWEFTYSPLSEIKQPPAGNLGIGQPAGGASGQSGTGGILGSGGLGSGGLGSGGLGSGGLGSGGLTGGSGNGGSIGGSSTASSPSPAPAQQQQ